MTKYTGRDDESKDRNTNSFKRNAKRGVKRYPFRDAAWQYRELGWTGTIPVTRRGTKAPLAPGITGHKGVDPNYDELEALVKEFPSANIGLRLPWDIVGIDIDAYDGRQGAQTIATISERLGPLPQTWKSTSRMPGDKISGIYLFHAPRSMQQVWVTDLGPGSGVEIAQYHHRFATVWPSIHNSTGRMYNWWEGTTDGSIWFDVGIPYPEWLPMLPVKWGNFLLSRHEYVVQSEAASEEVRKWYQRVAGGAMCTFMSAASEREAGKIRAAGILGGLHDTLIAAVTHLCTNAAEGHKGLDVALSVIEDAFIVSGRRRNLRSEWNGAVNSGMSKAAALRQESVDVCSLSSNWRRTS